MSIKRIKRIIKKKPSKSYKIVNFLIRLISKFFKEKNRQSLSVSLNFIKSDQAKKKRKAINNIK